MTPFDTVAAPAAELTERFNRDGFVVLPDALRRDEVDALVADAVRICRGEAGPIEGVTPAAPDETDDEVMRRLICIHYPHKVSDPIAATLSHPIVETLTWLIGPNVKAMQSMLFIKAEGKPGQAWHQDEFFIPTRDRSLTAAWIVLDDATIDNGCLSPTPAPATVERWSTTI